MLRYYNSRLLRSGSDDPILVSYYLIASVAEYNDNFYTIYTYIAIFTINNSNIVIRYYLTIE